MTTLKQKVEEFLAQKNIAVAGVTRNRPNEAANAIYRKLKGAGYHVLAINPNAETVEGDRCYPSLKSISEPIDGVVAVVKPNVVEELVRDCAEMGIQRVWMHRSFTEGSVSEKAVQFCQDNGINVIAGACPMMYCEPIDVGHKCIRWFLNVTNRLPK